MPTTKIRNQSLGHPDPTKALDTAARWTSLVVSLDPKYVTDVLATAGIALGAGKTSVTFDTDGMDTFVVDVHGSLGAGSLQMQAINNPESTDWVNFGAALATGMNTVTGFRRRIRFVYTHSGGSVTAVNVLALRSNQGAVATSSGGGGDASEATLATRLSQADFDTKIGSLTEAAPGTDTASSGLNGRAQRIAQNITSTSAALLAVLPAARGVAASAGALAVTIASDDVLIGIRTEAAPGTDTASSGLNGRLQRIAQNITSGFTSLLALLPASIGQKTAAGSLSVIPASDAVGPGVDVVASGVLGSNGATLAISCKGLATVVAEIDTGNLSATVTWEATNDDSLWYSISGLETKAGGQWQATDGSFFVRRQFNVAGFSQFRARVSAYTSGTSNARLRGSVAPGIVRIGPGMIVGVSGADNTSNTLGQFYDQSGGARLPGSAVHKLVSGLVWGRERMPDLFKTATATASGDTALWTPTSGKKVRVLKYQVEVTNDAAISGAAAILVVTLRDATTDLLLTHSFYIPQTGGTLVGAQRSGWIDLGNFGKVSALANNVLNINLSATITSGSVRVLVMGVEE